MLSSLHACLWLEGVTIDGEYKQFDDKTISSLFLGMSQRTSPTKKFEKEFRRDHNITSEYSAVKHIMEGNYQAGIEVLQRIEKETPNLYATASNLGTAYELLGNLPLAVQWIQEGINRDPNSHHGTEWLHVLILQAKQKLLTEPGFLNMHHLIDLTNSFKETDLIEIHGTPYSIAKIRDALFYQLRERMVFVKPQEPIVADLLYTFAKIEEQTTVLNEANKLLDMAINYGYTDAASIQEIRKSSDRAQVFMYLRYVGYFLLLVILLILYQRYQKKSSKG